MVGEDLGGGSGGPPPSQPSPIVRGKEMRYELVYLNK
jgi:hypothetical protein